uniref:neurotrimin-like n=1 Tax=Ciona intestinalis TaxID=7719 RepID=UPI000180D223|nr:neurotrimin-like [Ciona intestinalis]|eukprot:XP_002122555.1 neurotrimin-like [Ciona intestinalis]
MKWELLFGICVTVFVLHTVNANFIAPLKNKTVTQGEDIVISCKISAGASYVKRSWTHKSTVIFANGNKLPKDPRITLLSNEHNEYTMQVKNVNTNDEGFYTCSLYLNLTYKSTMHLTVNVPPQLTDVSEDKTVDEHDQVILRCIAFGKPQPRITWRHLVPSADGVRATSKFLPLGSVKRGSAGIYECTADNGVSSPVTRSIRLSVNYPPEIDETLSPTTVLAPKGQTFYIECVTSGFPDPTFQWIMPDGKTFKKQFSNERFNVLTTKEGINTISKFYFSPLQLSDYGNYTCIASNQMGRVNTTIALSRKIVPPTRPPPGDLFNRKWTGDGKGGRNNSPLAKTLLSNHILIVIVTSVLAFLL